jgi:hypothetical protein
MKIVKYNWNIWKIQLVLMRAVENIYKINYQSKMVVCNK